MYEGEPLVHIINYMDKEIKPKRKSVDLECESVSDFDLPN